MRAHGAAAARWEERGDRCSLSFPQDDVEVVADTVLKVHGLLSSQVRRVIAIRVSNKVIVGISGIPLNPLGPVAHIWATRLWRHVSPSSEGVR